MKRLLSLAMVILMLFFLFSCKPNNAASQSNVIDDTHIFNPESTETSAITTESTQSTESTVIPDEYTEYMKLPYYFKALPEQTTLHMKDLIGKKSVDYSFVINAKFTNTKIIIKLPERVDIDNRLTDKNIIILSVDGNPIGEIRLNNYRSSQYAKSISSDYGYEGSGSVITSEKYSCSYNGETWETPIFKSVCNQLNKINSTTISVRSDVLTIDQITEISRSLYYKYIPEATGAGTGDFKGKKCKIMILGNSFLGSSDIGNILDTIAKDNRKNLFVDARSIGMATVQTFATDPGIKESIKNGDYDYVFLCGFYDNFYNDYLSLLNITPDNTKLVIFPANNEDRYLPYSSFNFNAKGGICDWKGLINQFTIDGIDSPRLTSNDFYGHSTELAGYGGACLIYSYIYKEIAKEGTIEKLLAKKQFGYFKETEEQQLKDLAYMRKEAYDFIYN